MLRQKPHQRLMLFGTENLTWMIFHDGFLECHIGPSPSVGGYVLSNLEPETDAAISSRYSARQSHHCCAAARAAKRASDRCAGFIVLRNLRRPWN